MDVKHHVYLLNYLLNYLINYLGDGTEGRVKVEVAVCGRKAILNLNWGKGAAAVMGLGLGQQTEGYFIPAESNRK